MAEPTLNGASLDFDLAGSIAPARRILNIFRCRSQGLASLRDGHRRPSQYGMRKMKRNNLPRVHAVT